MGSVGSQGEVRGGRKVASGLVEEAKEPRAANRRGRGREGEDRE